MNSDQLAMLPKFSFNIDIDFDCVYFILPVILTNSEQLGCPGSGCWTCKHYERVVCLISF